MIEIMFLDNTNSYEIMFLNSSDEYMIARFYAIYLPFCFKKSSVCSNTILFYYIGYKMLQK